MLSVALAVRVTVPDTVALGAVTVTPVGGVVSALGAPAALKAAICMTQAAEPLNGAVAL